MVTRLTRALLVRDEEIGRVGFFVGFFLLLGIGTALGRGTTDALFFKRYGITYLPLMYALLSVLLAAVSVAYAAVADRLPPERSFRILFGVLIVLLATSWGMMHAGVSDLVYPFYFLLYEIASELLLVHASLYLSLNFDALQSKRIGPVAMAGGQLGIIIGGLLLAAGAPRLGVENILLLWGATLALGILLLGTWHRRRGVSPYFRPGRRERRYVRQSITQVSQGLKYMRSSELLRAASFALFFMVVAFYVLSYSVNRIYTESFTTEEQLTAFFGMLTVANSSVALLLQLFVTNRVIERFGVKRVNLVFPLTTILSYAGLLFSFALPTALFGSFNKDAVMTAFRNPVRNLFFNALPGHMQGRGRATSVVVVMPLALGAAGLILWLVQRIAEPIYFLVPGLLAALLYLHFNRRMNRAYAAEIIGHLRTKLYLPEDQLRNALRGTSDVIYQELERGVLHANTQISLAYARALVNAFPERAAESVFTRIESADQPTKDQLLKLLLSAPPPDLGVRLWRELDKADSHLRATILRILFQMHDSRAQRLIETGLQEENPRLRAAFIEGAILSADRRHRTAALQTWQQLVENDDTCTRLAALPLLPRLALLDAPADTLETAYGKALLALLQHPGERVRLEALEALEAWPAPSLPGLDGLMPALSASPEPKLRRAAVKATRLLAAPEREAALLAALEDSHPAVRRAAAWASFERDAAGVARMVTALLENNGSPRAQQALLDQLLEQGAPSDMLEQIALAKITDARSLMHATGALQHHGAGSDAPALRLLGFVLEERVRQSIDMALSAMQQMENPENIGVIRASLKCGDARHLASACEALRNLSHHALSPMLADLVEKRSPGAVTARAAEFPDLASVLTWCRRRLDPWLNSCAERALGALA